MILGAVSPILAELTDRRKTDLTSSFLSRSLENWWSIAIDMNNSTKEPPYLIDSSTGGSWLNELERHEVQMPSLKAKGTDSGLSKILIQQLHE